MIESTYTSGYNWCIDQVKASQYMDLAHSLDIDKAIGFLKQKDFQQVSSQLISFFSPLHRFQMFDKKLSKGQSNSAKATSNPPSPRCGDIGTTVSYNAPGLPRHLQHKQDRDLVSRSCVVQWAKFSPLPSPCRGGIRTPSHNVPWALCLYPKQDLDPFCRFAHRSLVKHRDIHTY